MTPPSDARPPSSVRGENNLLRLLAIGTAVSVATLYLSQPILNLLAGVLGASIRQMGVVTTLTQVGYAAGILFLVPLGDIIAKKRLILVKLFLVAAALALTALSTNVLEMAAGGLAIGLFATAAQDFLPLAAELSPTERRGHAIGVVMSGLLLGILGSRIFSGVLAQWLGWRSPFFAAALAALLVAFLVSRKVPSLPQTHAASYPALLRSMAVLLRDRPLLLLSTVGQGFIGLTFSAFWSMLSFYLGQSRFHLSPAAIGAFALAGFAGAAIAPIAGRLADSHGPLFNIRAGILLVAVSFGSMLVFRDSLVDLAVAAALFDLGVQVAMVSHQTIIYALEPSARSRINAVYVGGLFGFFALGSLIASWAFAREGWTGVVWLCLVSCALAAGIHGILSRCWHRRLA
jgi:predicted MFS family arabinose efflux permease